MEELLLVCIEILRGRKNLLAFSHGSDSTALFWALTRLNIDFDLAFVNYKTRKNSDLEQFSAQNLATKFGKKIFIKTAPLCLKKGDFENSARQIRWAFFDEICLKFSYENLITAHHLNDKFEWFLMQFSKGAGLNEMLFSHSIRKNYNIIRPFINTPKNEILRFLKQEKIDFFHDSSNDDIKFKRNFIRSNFSNKFIELYANGVKTSFELLQNDCKMLRGEILLRKFDFFVVKNNANSMRSIDLVLKNLGYLLSQKQRKEISTSCVIGGKFALEKTQNFIFIAPFSKAKMPKNFKEKCRTYKIPIKLRPYIYEKEILSEILPYFVP